MSENDPDMVPMEDQPAKPQYIAQQTNNNCQQFFGPITGCVFAMPGASVVQNHGTDTAPKAKGAKATTPKPERKSSVPKLTPKPANEKPRERMTFKKRGITDAHVSLLYHKMLELAWISPDNNEQDFRDLFSGELSDCKVIWGSKYGKSTLAFIFKYFESEGFIAVTKGFTIPNILMGHFVDEDGNYLTNLDNGDAPAPKSGEESVELLKTLKINAGRQGRRSCREDYDDEEESSLNPYELNAEGLHYTGRP